MQIKTALRIFAILLTLSAGQAAAHPGHDYVSSFAAGLAHPLFGVDHLLAMLAVGMWAARIGGKAMWGVPLTFMAAMAVGAVLAISGFMPPLVEPAIAASVLLLGLALAIRMELPKAVPILLVAAFAVFHGLAHGSEVPVHAEGMEYIAGFLLATGAIHLAGIALARAPGSSARQSAAGVPVALAGPWLLTGSF